MDPHRPKAKGMHLQGILAYRQGSVYFTSICRHNVCERKLFFLAVFSIVGEEQPASGTRVQYCFLLSGGHREALTWCCECTFPEAAVNQVGCGDYRRVILLLLLLVGLILRGLMGGG